MLSTRPGTWKLGVFWERTHAKIAQIWTKSPKIAKNRLVQSPESVEQLGCVPGSEHDLKSALVRVHDEAEEMEEMEASADRYRVQYEGTSGPALPARMECKLSATSSRAALVTAAGVATAGSSGVVLWT